MRCRWVIDASGRSAFLARKLGHFRQNTEHPINAVWARFTGVKDWDSYEWREKFPDYAAASRTGRAWATNHLMGQGWWCWIIPLKGGDFSAGLVYDSRIFTLPEGENLGERLRQHILRCIRLGARFSGMRKSLSTTRAPIPRSLITARKSAAMAGRSRAMRPVSSIRSTARGSIFAPTPARS